MNNFKTVAIEDASKNFTGRYVCAMYKSYDGSGRTILKFNGTSMYLVLPEGVEIRNGEAE